MSLEFELERFERVTAAPGSVLLRVAGRWYAAEPLRLRAPVLLVEDRDGSRRLTALPGPEEREPLASAQGPAWRAAFSASESLLAGGLSFGLDLGPEGIIDLPGPTERARSGPPQPGATSERVVERQGGVALDLELKRAHTATEDQARARAAAEREVQATARAAQQLTRERDAAVAAATAAERAALDASRQAERLADALRSARAEADEAREHAARALEQSGDPNRGESHGADTTQRTRELERRLRDAEALVEQARQAELLGDELEEIEVPQNGDTPPRRLPTETAVGLGVLIAAVIAAALLILGLVQVVLSS